MRLTPLTIIDRLRLRWKIISDDAGDPYLLRVYLTPERNWWRTRLPGLYLHRFFRGDHDRELHNHPWDWALSFILRGGYTEYRKDGRYAPVREYILRPGRLNIIWKDTYHRVELHDSVTGCWTLFIAAPRAARDPDEESWGFVSLDGKEYEGAQARDARLKRERAERVTAA